VCNKSMSTGILKKEFIPCAISYHLIRFQKSKKSSESAIHNLRGLRQDINPKGLFGAASTSQLDSTVACSVREHPLQYSVQCTRVYLRLHT
jgi:hypothetical protein